MPLATGQPPGLMAALGERTDWADLRVCETVGMDLDLEDVDYENEERGESAGAADDIGPADQPARQGRGKRHTDLHAWQVLRPLLDGHPYLPWNEGALRPAAMVKIINEIILGERRTIVELGSGVGTVVLARLLRERGGDLTSVEHEPAWARFVADQLEREGLTKHATMVVAPLVAHQASLDGAPWYDESHLGGLPRSIDLLLVDGPPGYGEGMQRSRYPAMPVLGKRVRPGGAIVLDDAKRPGEREITELWAQQSGLDFGLMKPEGIAIAAVPVD